MKMPRVIDLLASFAILAGFGSASLAEDLRFAGYLIDRTCANSMQLEASPTLSAQTHAKECALNEACSMDGYSLYSKGKWYQLDKKGSDLARKVLQASKTKAGHFVVVTGTAGKDELKVSTIKELAQSQD